MKPGKGEDDTNGLEKNGIGAFEDTSVTVGATVDVMREVANGAIGAAGPLDALGADPNRGFVGAVVD